MADVLNGNMLLYQLLLPKATELGAVLKPDLDVNSIDRLPFVTFTGRGGATLNDGGSTKPMAWGWSLDMSFFAAGEDAVVDLASAFYDHVHSWNLGELWVPPGQPVTYKVAGVGHAERITDRSLPSKVGSADLKTHQVVQYSGGWDLQLHQA